MCTYIFLACLGNCLTCPTGTSVCESCDDPYFLKDNLCVDAVDCDEDTAFYQNELTRVCEGMITLKFYCNV